MNAFKILAVLCLLILPGCDNKDVLDPSSFLKDARSEETALAAYSSLLSGDRTLMDDAQSEMWIPEFQSGMEYTYLDLDGDGTAELLVQMADDPCSYNAVFHFENGRIFCWNSDAVEMTCRDYPLIDSTMVRQYDYCGTRSYTIFRYKEGGKKEDIAFLFARDELFPENSPAPCPYYEIDGNEVSQTIFDEQLNESVTSRMLDRSVWTML